MQHTLGDYLCSGKGVLNATPAAFYNTAMYASALFHVPMFTGRDKDIPGLSGLFSKCRVTVLLSPAYPFHFEVQQCTSFPSPKHSSNGIWNTVVPPFFYPKTKPSFLIRKPYYKRQRKPSTGLWMKLIMEYLSDLLPSCFNWPQLNTPAPSWLGIII